MALIQKAFSDIITFSRSSNATRVGPTGVLEYAPHNLFTYSEDLTNAAWGTSTEVSVTANVVAAPNGTITADKVIEAANTGAHRVQRTNVSVNTIAHTYSLYAKAAERSWLFVQNPYETNANAWFNLSTGALGTVGAGASATIENAGNGWYRCSISVTSTISVGTVYFGPTTGDNTVTYTGDGTSGIYLWGAQLAVGPYALDYTPTTSAAVYGPRFDFDPVTLAPKGLLVEESRTNLLTYSEQFDNAAWTKSNTTVTANAAAAPNGTVTADLVTANTSSNFGFLYSTGTVSGVFTASVYAKQGTQRYIQLLSTATAAYWANFDLQDGLAYAGGTTSSVSIVSVGNGWYRCSMSVTDSSVNNHTIGFVTSLNSARAPSTTLTTNCYLWGAQLEAGSFATSYIPTLASTVTRSADVASVNTLSPWWNASAATFYIENTFGGFGNQPIALADQAAVGNAWIYSSTLGLIKSYTAGAALDLSSGVTVAANATVKSAFAYGSSGKEISVNGSTPVVSGNTTAPTASTQLSLGTWPGGSHYINGHIRRVAYYPRALSSAELQALTS